MNQVENKGRAIALLPIGVFLVIFLGSGIVTGDFYAMPAIVAFLIALAVAFMQNKQLSFAEKLSVISKGVGDENIITMSLIFLCAGGFSGAVWSDQCEDFPWPDTQINIFNQGNPVVSYGQITHRKLLVIVWYILRRKLPWLF